VAEMNAAYDLRLPPVVDGFRLKPPFTLVEGRATLTDANGVVIDIDLHDDPPPAHLA
jgi:hypothetical protein